MFGISFWELLLIGTVALLVVGPDKLPKMLGTLGRWSNKLRRITTEVRSQTGIDDMLRQQGIKGGLEEIRELRSLVKGNVAGIANQTMNRQVTPSVAGGSASAGTASSSGASTTSPSRPPARTLDPYKDIPGDRSREYPTEGCDSYGCLPDDLWSNVDEEAYEDEALHLEEHLAEQSKTPEQEPSSEPAGAAGTDDPAEPQLAEPQSEQAQSEQAQSHETQSQETQSTEPPSSDSESAPPATHSGSPDKARTTPTSSSN